MNKEELAQKQFEKDFPKQIKKITNDIFDKAIGMANEYDLDRFFVIEEICKQLQAKKREL